MINIQTPCSHTPHIIFKRNKSRYLFWSFNLKNKIKVFDVNTVPVSVFELLFTYVVLLHAPITASLRKIYSRHVGLPECVLYVLCVSVQSLGAKPLYLWLPSEVAGRLPAGQSHRDERRPLHQPSTARQQTNRANQEQEVPLLRYRHAHTCISLHLHTYSSLHKYS